MQGVEAPTTSHYNLRLPLLPSQLNISISEKVYVKRLCLPQCIVLKQEKLKTKTNKKERIILWNSSKNFFLVTSFNSILLLDKCVLAGHHLIIPRSHCSFPFISYMTKLPSLCIIIVFEPVSLFEDSPVQITVLLAARAFFNSNFWKFDQLKQP